MRINIASRHMDLTPAIEAYARKKAQRLTRYFDRIEQIDLVIITSPNGFLTESIVDIEHHDPIVSTGEAEDLYASIDQCTDRSIRQLTDHKSRLRDSKHNTSTGGKNPS